MLKHTIEHPQSTAGSRQPPMSRPIGAWLAYIVAAVAVPCMLLIGVEIVLRLFSVGYDPAFFLRVKKQDNVFCTDNPAFGRRFFPPTLVRMSDKLRFLLRKGDNERRIFVLGSSAAQGEPAPAFAFSRDLDCMLQGRYGPTHCEIINTAMTAINSHEVVPIARECSCLSPDIFIVYMGNNEVIGPFGPGTVFSGVSNLWFIRLRVFLSSTRLGQLASALSASVSRKNGTPAGWGGMKMFLQHKFRFDDPAMNGVYRNFQENLRDICRAAHTSGARVVLCTVASNLKDCGPFFSMHASGLSSEALKQWEEYYEQAVERQRQGRLTEALSLYTKAASIDSTHADTRFRMARCLLALGRADEARGHFIAARDFDALRFRADSRLNRIVNETAREFPGCAVVFDAENHLSAAPNTAPCGEELFLEHVHYNFHGNYQFAAGLLPLLDSLIGAPITDSGIVSEAQCRERLAYTPWEELRVDQEIFGRLTKPPFTDQEVNLRRAIAFKEEINRLIAFAADSGQAIVARYQRAASLEPKDWRIYEQLGNYLLRNDTNPRAAEQALRAALDFLPDNEYARNSLAIALERQGRTPEAIDQYREAIRVNPLFFEPYVNLADDLAMLSRLGEAEQCLKQVLRINPELPSAKVRYAQLQLRRGKAASTGKTTPAIFY